MSRIGIISNPHAKLNKRNPQRQKLLSYIAGEEGIWELTESLEALEAAVQNFKSRNVAVIAINGGDGTVSRTITAIIHIYGNQPLPQIALLRGGTINMLADNLGIKGSPEKLLFNLIFSYSQGLHIKTKILNTLNVAGNHGFLFATGLAPRFLSKFYENKTGAFGAIKLVLGLTLSGLFGGAFAGKIVKDEFYQIKVDQYPPLDHTSIGITAGSVRKMPFRIPFFKLVDGDNHFFQIIVIKTRAVHAFIRILKIVFANALKNNPDKISYIGRKLDIICEEPFEYTLDGELYNTPDKDLTLQLGAKIEFLLI